MLVMNVWDEIRSPTSSNKPWITQITVLTNSMDWKSSLGPYWQQIHSLKMISNGTARWNWALQVFGLLVLNFERLSWCEHLEKCHHHHWNNHSCAIFQKLKVRFKSFKSVCEQKITFSNKNAESSGTDEFYPNQDRPIWIKDNV